MAMILVLQSENEYEESLVDSSMTKDRHRFAGKCSPFNGDDCEPNLTTTFKELITYMKQQQISIFQDNKDYKHIQRCSL